MNKFKLMLVEKAEMLHHINRLLELFDRIHSKQKCNDDSVSSLNNTQSNLAEETNDDFDFSINEKLELSQKIAITGGILALFAAGIFVAVKIYKMGVYKQKWSDYDDCGYS